MVLVLNFPLGPKRAMMNIVLGRLGTAMLGAMTYHFGATAEGAIRGRPARG
jgi:hypothetical protein